MEVVRKGCLSVNKPECLQCKHLVAFSEDETDRDCTVDQGNDMCPAQSVQIVIGANVSRAAEAIASAMRAQDAEALAKKMKRLSGYHESVQKQVMSAVNALMAKQPT